MRRLRWLLGLGLTCGAIWWAAPLLLQPWLPQPQLILVLGGDLDRERAAARLARSSGLPVLVSGGSNSDYAHWLFEGHGIAEDQLQLDYAARDTLGNFTTVVDRLRARGIRHVLLITSADHMARALLVGRLVAGSRGIHLSPLEVPCGDQCREEPFSKVWGDGLRALVWVFSGRDLRQEMQRHPAGR
tara:strand:- start:55 stop:615 length:561 start_codon:yes stop_codon:yes gene_type:complete